MSIKALCLSLAFGNPGAVRCDSLLAFSEQTKSAVPTLIQYDARNPSAFRARSSHACINELSLFAASMPDVHTQARVDGRNTQTLVFHAAGKCAFATQGGVYSAVAGQSAVFLPRECPWVVETLSPSTVVATIEKHKIEATARVMLGSSFKGSLASGLNAPVELAMSVDKLSFDAIFRRLFAQIDLYEANPAMLSMSGLDDIFYRTLAMALFYDAFRQSQERRFVPATSARQLAWVCDYVYSNLGGQITLTDLEKIGHASRRTLHNAFIKAYGMSPMHWVKEQRLMAARGCLNNPLESRSITEVLYDCGFTNASLFAAHYVRRFGEKPSDTRFRVSSSRVMGAARPVE